MTKNRMMRWFAFGHLRDGKMQDVSRKFTELAEWLDENVAEGAEKTAGMRKLVEAKDCFVRAVIEEQEG